MTDSSMVNWQWIGDADSLARAVDILKSAEWVAVDTEFRRRDTFHPQVALVQLATTNACWLIDPLTLSDTTELTALLTCSSVIKVIHSASEDLEVFEHWLGCLPTPLFDTQKAAAMLHRGFGLSYRALVELYLGIPLDKEETQSDWLARPLSGAQLRYAAMDVVYLAQLYPALYGQVSDCGRLAWVLEEGSRAETGGRGPLAKFKSAWKLSSAQQAALIDLVDWREAEARKRDKPRSWILADKTISAMVQRKPTSVEALAGIEGVSHGLVRRAGSTLLERINAPSDAAQQRVQNAFVRPATGRVKALAKQLTGTLEALAEQHGINVELVLPSRELELIARLASGEAVVHPPHWQGWRYNDFIAPLLLRAKSFLEDTDEAG